MHDMSALYSYCSSTEWHQLYREQIQFCHIFYFVQLYLMNHFINTLFNSFILTLQYFSILNLFKI